MRIETGDGIAKVFTPYNERFARRIRNIGGAKWTGEYWKVPAAYTDVVREIMLDVYGYNDITENRTVTLRVTFPVEAKSYCSDVVLFGKVISHATGRDSGARVGADVAFIKGGVYSGGSCKNWYSYVKEGSEVILTNVNENVFRKESEEEPEYQITVTVLEDVKDKGELLAEKERLLKRIEEIDRALGLS